jgi:transcription elongation factor GreA
MSERVPMTAQGYEKLKEDLKELKTVERPKNVKEISEAIAHGDLSENAEYHAAKEKQGHLEARISMIEDRLARAQVIDMTGQTPDRVRFGCTVRLEDIETGEQVRYTIVGEDEADVAQGRISITSPVGRALMGKEVDDTVGVSVPKGSREFDILEILIES